MIISKSLRRGTLRDLKSSRVSRAYILTCLYLLHEDIVDFMSIKSVRRPIRVRAVIGGFVVLPWYHAGYNNFHFSCHILLIQLTVTSPLLSVTVSLARRIQTLCEELGVLSRSYVLACPARGKLASGPSCSTCPYISSYDRGTSTRIPRSRVFVLTTARIERIKRTSSSCPLWHEDKHSTSRYPRRTYRVIKKNIRARTTRWTRSKFSPWPGQAGTYDRDKNSQPPSA